MVNRPVAPDGQSEVAIDEFVTAVAESMDELERKIVEVTGIEGNDDDGQLVVGRINFDPGYAQDLPRDEEMTGESLKRLPSEPACEETLGEGEKGGGQRMNKGKLRMDLTPPEWEVALADVTTQGSKKYAERNWELGMSWNAMIGCIKRHMVKFQAGERYDGEKFDLEKGTTGCHHLAMVAWNALALMSYDLRDIGENNMPPIADLDLLKRVNAETSDKGNSLHDKY